MHACDINPGDQLLDGVFDLDEFRQTNYPGLDILFYTSVEDAYLEQNPISGDYSTESTVIYARVENANECDNVDVINLVVNPIPSDERSLYACDIDSGDQLLDGVFDLDEFRQTNYPGLDILFYTSVEDAYLEQNPISGDYSTESTVIYARVENTNECDNVDVINLVVNPTPTLAFESELLWCTDGSPLPINAPLGFDIYRWFRAEGAAFQEVSNQASLQISAVGEYVLEVGYSYTLDEGIFECTNQTSFNVLPSNSAKIENIDVGYISDNNLVEVFVSGDGDYEYSLDAVTYQDSPLFENVNPGFITVSVRDKNGCGISREPISVIGYPKFFTPNGDGINDSWQILRANEQFQAESLIFIYDRHNRLLALISPGTEGWDGTFNNRELPASDYWFKVVLEDGQIFKGHFALKR